MIGDELVGTTGLKMPTPHDDAMAFSLFFGDFQNYFGAAHTPKSPSRRKEHAKIGPNFHVKSAPFFVMRVPAICLFRKTHMRVER